jgi:hypothetical protein
MQRRPLRRPFNLDLPPHRRALCDAQLAELPWACDRIVAKNARLRSSASNMPSRVVSRWPSLPERLKAIVGF